MIQGKVGDKIKIIKMKGEPEYEGLTGEILLIDHMGQLHGTWGGLAVLPDIDKYEILDD